MAKIQLSKAFVFILTAIFIALPFYRAAANSFDSAAVVELINADRAKSQLEPLRVNGELTQAANDKAYDMFAHGYFAHNAPDGTTPWHWLEKNGYDYAYAGENLAINFTDAQSQNDALMASQSHRDNILKVKYQDVGVAVVTGIMNGRQTTITVQEFGAKSVTRSSEVAGATVGSSTGQAAGSGFEKMSAAAGGVLNSLSDTADSNFLSSDGWALTYGMLMTIALMGVASVVLGGHVHILAHLFSHRRHAVKIPVSQETTSLDHVSSGSVDSLHFGKIYLTHMKMRK